MELTIRLYPPLNDTAGRDTVRLAFEGVVTVQRVVDALVERFGPVFRRHLYDAEGRFIPAWCVFVDERPVQLNRLKSLQTPLEEGNAVSFLLNVAGG
jgi:molybdopterin converting factor small subunit